MHLSEIWIYPVKSLGGIRLKEAKVEEKGLQHDRRWMIVDQHGRFITQRTNSKMALLDVAITSDGLLISERKDQQNYIQVPFENKHNNTLEVKVWKDNVCAYTVGKEIDDWLSTNLGKPVRLVSMDDLTHRPMDTDYAAFTGAGVSFADDFPYLLTCESSLKDLNDRLVIPVEMKRFRANFIISGSQPFEEDTWQYIEINGLHFNVAKSCERCVMINIDPFSGSKGLEPMKTLATYRKENKNILFGQNLTAQQTGIVREGDRVEFVRK